MITDRYTCIKELPFIMVIFHIAIVVFLIGCAPELYKQAQVAQSEHRAEQAVGLYEQAIAQHPGYKGSYEELLDLLVSDPYLTNFNLAQSTLHKYLKLFGKKLSDERKVWVTKVGKKLGNKLDTHLRTLADREADADRCHLSALRGLYDAQRHLPEESSATLSEMHTRKQFCREKVLEYTMNRGLGSLGCDLRFASPDEAQDISARLTDAMKETFQDEYWVDNTEANLEFCAVLGMAYWRQIVPSLGGQVKTPSIGDNGKVKVNSEAQTASMSESELKQASASVAAKLSKVPACNNSYPALAFGEVSKRIWISAEDKPPSLSNKFSQKTWADQFWRVNHDILLHLSVLSPVAENLSYFSDRYHSWKEECSQDNDFHEFAVVALRKIYARRIVKELKQDSCDYGFFDRVYGHPKHLGGSSGTVPLWSFAEYSGVDEAYGKALFKCASKNRQNVKLVQELISRTAGLPSKDIKTSIVVDNYKKSRLMKNNPLYEDWMIERFAYLKSLSTDKKLIAKAEKQIKGVLKKRITAGKGKVKSSVDSHWKKTSYDCNCRKLVAYEVVRDGFFGNGKVIGQRPYEVDRCDTCYDGYYLYQASYSATMETSMLFGCTTAKILLECTKFSSGATVTINEVGACAEKGKRRTVKASLSETSGWSSDESNAKGTARKKNGSPGCKLKAVSFPKFSTTITF